jgi:hypothetical protein
MTAPEYVYRFRSIDRLLGSSRELERQEIYLAAPEELDDPMEGYQDVFWRGDQILWENLLRHYLLSLLWSAAGCLIMDAQSFTEPQIPATLTEDALPTDAFRALYRHICKQFFTGSGLSALPERLASLTTTTPLRLDGLRFVLSSVHLSAFSSVVAGLRDHGLIKGGGAFDVPPDLVNTLNEMFAKLGEGPDELEQGGFETLAFAANRVRDDQALKILCGLKTDASSASNRKMNYLLLSFPDRYAKGVTESLIHPGWYTACFSAACTNASMWSTYADGHRGVALVFRPQVSAEGHPTLVVSGVTGFTASRSEPNPRWTLGNITGILHEVQYATRPPEIDFFQFLARLPRSKLMSAWHTNQEGAQSPVVADVVNDVHGWRNKLQASFQRMVTTKLEDWKHEKEFRFVVADSLGMHRENRTVRYEFSQLAGIVFGVRTATADKLKIIKLILQKCPEASRKDFNFWQMSYRASEGRLIKV